MLIHAASDHIEHTCSAVVPVQSLLYTLCLFLGLV